MGFSKFLRAREKKFSGFVFLLARIGYPRTWASKVPLAARSVSLLASPVVVHARHRVNPDLQPPAVHNRAQLCRPSLQLSQVALPGKKLRF